MTFPYYNAVEEIYNAHWTSRKVARLVRLRSIVESLWPGGHPTQVVLVAGTSGKGSVCRYLEAMLGRSGSAASYTNPHVWDFRERFSVNGKLVSREDVAGAWEGQVRGIVAGVAADRPDATLGVHEVCVLLSLVLFARFEVEWAAFEASIGGRYDAINALARVASVVTNVGSDHHPSLGETRWQRALNKAGIFHPGVPAFSADGDPEVHGVLESVAGAVGADLTLVSTPEFEEVGRSLAAVFPDGPPRESLLNGPHQVRNLALARAVARRLTPAISDEDLLLAAGEARLRGRFEEVEPGVYADVAHNADKISALLETIEERLPERKRTIFVVGVSGSRSPRDVLRRLAGEADELIVTASTHRGLDPDGVAADVRDMIDEPKVTVVPDPAAAVAEAKRRRSDSGDVVIVTGSTYVLDEALNPDPHVRHLNAVSDWRRPVATDGLPG